MVTFFLFLLVIFVMVISGTVIWVVFKVIIDIVKDLIEMLFLGTAYLIRKLID